MGLIKKIRDSVRFLSNLLTPKGNSKDGEYIALADSAAANTKSVRSPALVYMGFALLGAGSMVPGNAFVSELDYFEYLYPDSNIDAVFTISYLVPCLLVLAILIPYGDKFSAKSRVNAGLIMDLSCIVMVPIMEAMFIHGEPGNSGTYFVTVFGVVRAGIGDALVQGTLMGSAGELPEQYMQAIVCGTGFSGVLISLLAIISKATLPRTVSGLRFSANIYFGVSAVFLIVCIVAYNLIHELTIPIPGEDGSKFVDGESGRTGLLEAKADVSNLESCPVYGAVDSSAVSHEWVVKGDGLVPPESGYSQVMNQLKWLAGGICLTYIVSLTAYPAYITEVLDSVFLGDWYPVLLVATFNMSDLLGRSVSVLHFPKNELSSIVASAFRVLFIPLLAVCLHGPATLRTELPIFFFASLVGVTNGYLTVCFFLMGPRLVRSVSAHRGGVIMVMFQQLGFSIGSLLGWVWVAWT